jgi:hypothetical protein
MPWGRRRIPRWRDDRSAQQRTHGQRLECSTKEARTWLRNDRNERLGRPQPRQARARQRSAPWSATAWVAPPKSRTVVARIAGLAAREVPYSALDELAEYSRQELSGIERVRG